MWSGSVRSRVDKSKTKQEPIPAGTLPGLLTADHALPLRSGYRSAGQHPRAQNKLSGPRSYAEEGLGSYRTPELPVHFGAPGEGVLFRELIASHDVEETNAAREGGAGSEGADSASRRQTRPFGRDLDACLRKQAELASQSVRVAVREQATLVPGRTYRRASTGSSHLGQFTPGLSLGAERARKSRARRRQSIRQCERPRRAGPIDSEFHQFIPDLVPAEFRTGVPGEKRNRYRGTVHLAQLPGNRRGGRRGFRLGCPNS